jgi:taurine dioxygenase
MGQPIEYPFVRGIDGFPEIIEVKKLPHETVNFGGVWHSDTTYLPEPPKASMLLAREVPPRGGDTLFANMYLAYEALSHGLRSQLDGLIAINSSAKADVSRTREDRIQSDGRDGAAAEHVAEHPAVRTHPQTGRRALYVNRAHTVGFRDVDAGQGEELLARLFEHVERPEFSVRFQWRAGSIALWDNRCTQHYPVNDYQGHKRLMHRITLAGDRPR